MHVLSFTFIAFTVAMSNVLFTRCTLIAFVIECDFYIILLIATKSIAIRFSAF